MSDFQSGIKEAIASQFELDPAIITDRSQFFDYLDIDSLGLIELAMLLEGMYGVEITDKDLKSVERVEDLVRVVKSKETGS